MSEEKKQKSDEIKEFGALMLNEKKKNYKIRLLTIIGEIEGHETVSNNTKATNYEHFIWFLLFFLAHINMPPVESK